MKEGASFLKRLLPVFMPNGLCPHRSPELRDIVIVTGRWCWAPRQKHVLPQKKAENPAMLPYQVPSLVRAIVNADVFTVQAVTLQPPHKIPVVE